MGAIMAMIDNQKGKIVNLVEDIDENGLSDAERFIVIKAKGQPHSYITLDGNRRLVALKLLQNPALAEGNTSISSKLMGRLRAASHKFKADPINRVEIVVYADRASAAPWLERRHSIDMKGVGQERWDSVEIRRFLSRMDDEGKAVKESPELQVMDFVINHGNLTPAEHEQIRKRRFITNLRRIIIDAHVRESIGYTIESNVIFTDLPDSEIIKPFKRMVLDLTLPDKDERIDVTDLEDAEDRADYIDGFTFEYMPSSSAKPVKLHILGQPNEALPEPEKKADEEKKAEEKKAEEKEAEDKKADEEKKAEEKKAEEKEAEDKKAEEKKKAKKPRKPRKKTTNQRLTIIPEDCHLTIEAQRIHDIYDELQVELDSEKCTNACAVLLRVFIELSLDDYIKKHTITLSTNKSSPSLSTKLYSVTQHVVNSGLLSKENAEPIYGAAKTEAVLAPTVLQMHTYVHRDTSTPLASDLRKHWNNLQPLMEIIWP